MIMEITRLTALVTAFIVAGFVIALAIAFSSWVD
jgi:hypothetical protein